ncbi:MAG: hypothetical protein ABGY32_14210, partial [bacterium]
MSRPKKPDTNPAMAFERPIQEFEFQLSELEELAETTHLDISEEIVAMRQKIAMAIHETYADLSAWDQVN